jgi:hypothetical protein
LFMQLGVLQLPVARQLLQCWPVPAAALLLLLHCCCLLLLLLLCCQIMGPAMEPTFSGQGDVVLVERLPGMLDRARPGEQLYIATQC